jgi:DNA invertase Pin-like site-specific DNA recombinase
MAIIGYAKAAHDRSIADQEAALNKVGCHIIRIEEDGRAVLASVLAFLRRGDTLVVTNASLLAGSMAELIEIMRPLKAEGSRWCSTAA